MLPSVIDDIDMGITHVVRGEDHVTNSGIQTQMFQALGTQPPVFAHISLLIGADGALSKRMGSMGVDQLREEGVEPLAIVALLARLGTADPVEPVADVQPLIDSFDLGRFSRAPSRFDPAELKQLNARILHQLDFEQVRDRLPDAMGEEAWLAIRPNLATLDDVAHWWRIITGPVAATVAEEDRQLLTQAAALLDHASFDGTTWKTLTDALKAHTGRKGKALFLPLRMALTGMDHGPEMAALLPLIGREQAVVRLRQA